MHNTLKPRWLVEVIAVWGYVQRNYFLTKRYFMWELVWLTFTTVNAMSITFIGAGVEMVGGGEGTDTERLMTFLLVGALIWSYLSMIFDVLSETVQWERWEGTIEYTFMSPTSRVTHLLGMGVYAVVYGIARTAVVLGVAMLAFDLDLSAGQLLGRPGRPRRVQHLARRLRGGSRRDAAALAGEGPAGDVYSLGPPAPRLGRLLPRQGAPRLDAGDSAVLAGHVRARRIPRRAPGRCRSLATVG